MNKKTIDTLRLWRIFKEARKEGKISSLEYQKSLVLLFDKISIINNDEEKVDELLEVLEKKIKSQNYDLIYHMEYILCPN